MENGRRKIRLCLFGIILAAVVIGVCYYYGNSGQYQQDGSEGTLVKFTQEEQDGR